MIVVGMSVAIAAASNGRQDTDQKLTPYTETLPGTVVKIQMVPVPGGSIKIGDKTVAVKPFYMATMEMPWEAFDAFTQSGPPSKPYDQSDFPADAVARPSKSYILPDLGWGHHGYPAINLSFTSVDMFCRWMASATKKKYRLPTEAEWELACRAGAKGDFKIDKGSIEKQAWYKGNSGRMTHPIGTKEPNKLGIFDLLGNVGEWAIDLDGKPILCGGTFQDEPDAISPTTRKKYSPKWQLTDPQLPKSRWWLSDAPFCGFRVICEP